MINLDNYEKYKNELNSDSQHMIEFYKMSKTNCGMLEIRLASKNFFPNQKFNSINNPDLSLNTFFDNSFEELKKYKIINQVEKFNCTSTLENGEIEFGVLFRIS